MCGVVCGYACVCVHASTRACVHVSVCVCVWCVCVHAGMCACVFTSKILIYIKTMNNTHNRITVEEEETSLNVSYRIMCQAYLAEFDSQ